jgi:Antibiotic biosynthesis monooxygenase
MIYLEVQHTVADYAKWRAAFDNHRAARMSFGATGVEQVYRGLENPNAITVITEWKSAEDAQRFAQDPTLKEAMAAGGVTSAPEATFLNRV